MKKLIFRKISKDLLIFFSFSIILLGLIVWTLQAINYFDLVSEDGHGIKIYLQYSALNFPKIVHRLLPFVFFVSLFYVLVSYENKNELSILWINGINKVQFANKIIILSILLMTIQIINGSFFSPMSQFKARNLLKNSDIGFFSSLIKEGKFINVIKGLTIFIKEKNDDGSYSEIYLDDSSTLNPRIIYAKNGMLVDNKKQKAFKLYDGKVIDTKDSKINIFEFDQINFNLKDYSSNTITQPKIQEINTLDLIKCLYYKDNFNTRKIFRCEKNVFKEIKQELLKRLYKPIYLPIIAIITCFVILNSKNKTNYIKVRNLTFIFVITVIIFSEASLRYSVSSQLSLLMYLLIPIFLLTSIYILFLRLAKNV